MKAIILAAGVGSRLGPFTENTPKCLFKLGKGLTVLERMVDIAKKNIQGDIIVVTGYQSLKIEQLITGVTLVHNPFYQITNSIASLWFAREYLDDDVILINSDLVFQESLFKEIKNFDSPAFVTVDSSKISEADYKVAVFDDRVVMMDKGLNEFFGEYAGITKLSKNSALGLREKITNMTYNGQFGEWYETALVSMILDENFCLNYMDVHQYQWTEIDTPNDFLEAKKIHEMGIA